jgi:indole-3-acetate monooxygenase
MATQATTARGVPTTATGVLDAVHRLTPDIAGRAAEIEAARRLPPDLLDQLVAAGCFRLLVPATYGGIEADLPAAIDVFEALARADTSVGWTVMIGAGSWCDLAGLPRPTFDDLFARGPDVITAGVFNPTATIAAVDGGYRVTGRWAFASGCEHADWIFGNCVEAVDGPPQLRVALFTPEQIQIEDTWTVSGLAGTGSHHFRADDVVVPAERTAVAPAHEPCIDTPILRVPAPSAFALVIASIAIGTAQGALDDIVALAVDKVPLLAPGPLAANPLFQFELARADTELRAAQALLHDTAAATWDTITSRSPLTLEARARIRAAAVWITERAAAVVDAAYRSGGGSSVYAASPLQRRRRDIHAVTQHVLVRPDTLTTAGAVLAGRDIDVMVF